MISEECKGILYKSVECAQSNPLSQVIALVAVLALAALVVWLVLRGLGPDTEG